MVIAFVENHHLILFGTSAELFTTTLAVILYKDIKLLALVKFLVSC